MEISLRLLLILFLVIFCYHLLSFDPYGICFYEQDVTKVLSLLFVLAALILEFISVHLQKKNNLLVKKSIKRFFRFLLIVLVIAVGLLVFVSFPCCTTGRAKDSRIVSAVGQMRVVMTYIGSQEGSYDNVNCSNSEMKPLCKEVDNNYRAKIPMLNICRASKKILDGKEPVIVRAPLTNSQVACIYSPLNSGGYYCADSEGYAGATTTDPSKAGCSLEGGARCPAGLVNP